MRVRRLTACVLVLAICGLGLANRATVETARAANKVTITVWIPDYTTPLTQNFYKDTLLPAFHKENPEISVNMVYVDWSVYDQKVNTAFAGNSAPDVLQTGAEYVPNLVSKGQIQTIDPYLPSWGHRKDFLPGAWQNTVWQGHNYGVPYLSGVRGLTYRKSLFKAAGIAHPPTTWDELYADAVKLTKHDAKGKLTQIGFLPEASNVINYWQSWLPFFEGAGGTPTTPDGKKATINNAAGIAATRFFARLFQAMTPGGVGLSSKMVAPFPSGHVAMRIQDSYVAIDMQQYNPRATNDVGVARPLIGPGPHGRRVSMAYNDWLAISAQTKNAAAAWKWITFATRPEYIGPYDQTNGEIPTNVVAAQAPWVKSNPIFRQFVENVFPYAVAHPFFPHMIEMRDKVGAHIEKVAYGKETAEQAMQAAEAEANTVLGGTSTH